MNILQYSDNPAVAQAISAIADPRKIRVLCVGLGNICRSPAADGIMHRLVEERGGADRWFIDSAGTGGWHVGDLPDPRMRAHALRRGLTLDHICRQVRPSDFDDFDLIIGMDSGNLARLHEMAPSIDAERKILPMAAFFGDYSAFDHVPDPYYDGAQGFETVLDILEDATVNLYDTVTANLPLT